ncbi:Similar to rad21: Double-strand-break repair protein rad21 homolog (Xenopus laevis) [Cotesia congregata]|uniref:Similar to rad21: Double-strand-break repair protein rad21 homolog (Xenopus laevis) n=1 Tax=Cotesia congregata TaxID=51543 RepID=A0A8J2HP18_COTCN|nr:Similar to rad21: Double-strand-break repair protein rad21 homolog (Xenopus laevis) [Cotesia congregata]
MFYAHFVLAKKGPLARIWLAAHWDKKLTKAHVFETNIEKSVDGILQPKVKMALRTSGHLLLGVVRIYSRKAKYLLADCNEAFVKIKMAFRPGMVDLPEEHREAAVTAITLPEVFHDFDTAMPELKDVDIEAQFSLNQSRVEEITMREDYGNLSLVTHDQGFGDMSFDADPPELLRHGSTMEAQLDQSHMLFSDGPSIEAALEPKEKEPIAGTSTAQPMDIDTPIRDDGFGGHLGQDIISGGLFEGGLFDEAPMGEVPVPEVSNMTDQQDSVAAVPGAPSVHDDSDDMGDHFGGAPSPMGGMSSDGSRPTTPVTQVDGIAGRASVASRRFTPVPPTIPEEAAVDAIEQAPRHLEQTTLLHDEEESFALAPVDASALKGFTKAKRKRKLIVDEVKNISGEEMKAQLSDTSDIVTTLDLAPPTKRLMHWKETGGVEKLFALPARPIPARVLFKNYQRHLTSKSYDHEDFGRMAGDDDSLSLEQMRDGDVDPASFDQSSIGKRLSRKRKAPADEEPLVQPMRTPGPPPPVPMEETPMETVEPTRLSAPPPVIPPPAQSPAQSEVSLPAEPSIPLIEPSMEATEMPQIPPADVSSLLGEEPLQPADSMMENMGYDQAQPQVSYMGFDENQPPVNTPGAAHMYQVIKNKLDGKDRLTLGEMSYKNSRKQAAQKFYTLLVLKKFQVLELNQEYSYAEILVTKGPKWENPSL